FPAPFFVSPPAPLTTPLRTTLPAPAMVRSDPPLLMLPVTVSVPAVEPMVLALARATAPPQVLLPLTLRRLPVPAAGPAPLIVSASPATLTPPWTWRTPPADTVVPFVVPPRAVL